VGGVGTLLGPEGSSPLGFAFWSGLSLPRTAVSSVMGVG
jgi:hypothetical protein